MSRARLGRYALYQMRDYAIERGLVTALLLALTLGPPLFIVTHEQGPGWGRGAGGAAFIARILVDIAVPLSTLAVLFAVNGIASLDRQRGYFRFLFAKPLSVPAYYAQDFAVRFVGVLVVSALSGLTISVGSGGAFPWNLVAYVALVYVLLGSVGFLLSALVQFDGLVLVLVWFVSAIVFQIRASYPRWVPDAVVWVVPPVDGLDLARNAWLGGIGAFPAADLWWVIGYGAACFVLGLVVLRRRPLAT